MEALTIEGGKGTIKLGPDGFISLVCNPDIVLEFDDAQTAMAKLNEISAGSRYPMLVDMTNTQSVTRQARSVFSIPCAASRIALLGSSPVDRVVANFTLGLQSLACPTRFFTSRDETMSWLLQAPLP